jgi:hypothetical protein
MKIEYYEAKDNPMFPPEITMLIRFVRPEKAVKCAICGKMRKRLWTMLVPFRGQVMNQFAMTPSDELEALIPICDDHPMIPVFIELAKKIAKQPLQPAVESSADIKAVHSG